MTLVTVTTNGFSFQIINLLGTRLRIGGKREKNRRAKRTESYGKGKGWQRPFPPKAGRMRNVSVQERMSIGFLAQYVYDKHGCLTARTQIPYARTFHEVFHMYRSGQRKKHVHDTLVSLHFI